MIDDFYERLGVDKSAETEDIKAAYRRLVRLTHPDTLSAGVSDAARERAASRFNAVVEAYETLSDPHRRATYDRMRHLAGRAKKDEATTGPVSIVQRVRQTLGIAPADFAAELGLSEAALNDLEARNLVPQTPVQRRTFAHFCEQAAQRLEGHGQFTEASELRSALERKQSGHRVYR